jgi:hypothetical protein
MATFIKIQDFSEQLTKGIHQFGTHTFKLALCSAEIVATNVNLAAVTQIAYTNISGGAAPTVTVTVSETTGTTTVGVDQVVITATDTVPTFQYYAIYNDTATGDPLVCAWNHGSAVNLAAGETFTINFNNDSTAGTIFTLA